MTANAVCPPRPLAKARGVTLCLSSLPSTLTSIQCEFSRSPEVEESRIVCSRGWPLWACDGVRFLCCLPGNLDSFFFFFFKESVDRALNASVVHTGEVGLGI